MARRDRRQPEPSTMLHHRREARVAQHRHMAENVVEQVGLLEIIELREAADEIAHRKHPLGQHREEDQVGHQPRHRHRAPPGPRFQLGVQLGQVGNPRLRQMEQIEPVEKRRDDALAQRRDLPFEQDIPHAVVLAGKVLPALRDDIILPAATRAERGLMEGWLRHGHFPGAIKNPAERMLGGAVEGLGANILSRSPPRLDNNNQPPTRLSACRCGKGRRSGSSARPRASRS